MLAILTLELPLKSRVIGRSVEDKHVVFAEHVEHFVIPLTDTAREAESDAEAAMEIIEPEPQHAPTEEDVEAMLAATAASLLSANLKSDAPDADRVDSDRRCLLSSRL